MKLSVTLKRKLTTPEWVSQVEVEDQKVKNGQLIDGRSVISEPSSKRMYLPSDDKEVTCYDLAERFVGVSGDHKWKKMCKNINDVLGGSRNVVDAKVDNVRRILDSLLKNPKEINEIPNRYLFCIMHSLTFIVRYQGEGKEVAYALIDRVINLREAAEVTAICKALHMLGCLMADIDRNEAECISCFENKVDKLLELFMTYCIPKLRAKENYSAYCYANLRSVVVGLSKIYSYDDCLGGQSKVQIVLDFVIALLHKKRPPLPANAILLIDVLGSLLSCEKFVYEEFNRKFSSFLKHAVSDLQAVVREPRVLDSIPDAIIIKLLMANSRTDYIYTDKFQCFMDVLVSHIAKHIDRLSVSQLKKISKIPENNRSLCGKEIHNCVIRKLLEQEDSEWTTKFYFQLLESIFMQDEFSVYSDSIHAMLNKLMGRGKFAELSVSQQYKVYWYFLIAHSENPEKQLKIDEVNRSILPVVKRMSDSVPDQSEYVKHFLHRHVNLRSGPPQFKDIGRFCGEGMFLRQCFVNDLKARCELEGGRFCLTMDGYFIDAVFEKEKLVLLYKGKKGFIVYDKEDKSESGYRQSLLTKAINDAINKMGYTVILAPFYAVDTDEGVDRFVTHVKSKLREIRSKKEPSLTRSHQGRKEEDHRKRQETIKRRHGDRDRNDSRKNSRDSNYRPDHRVHSGSSSRTDSRHVKRIKI